MQFIIDRHGRVTGNSDGFAWYWGKGGVRGARTSCVLERFFIIIINYYIEVVSQQVFFI